MSCWFLLSSGPSSLLPQSACPALTSFPSSSFSTALHLLCRLPWEGGQTEAPGRRAAPGCAPFSSVSDVRWLCLPGSVDLLLVPTVLLALLFLSSHCFLILSHCAPSTFFQVHFCIYFGQGSISRGFTFPCNRQPPAQLGTQGIGWKGSRMPGVSLLCTQTLSFHRTEVLYVGCFFFVVIQWLIKIAPTYLVLTVYQEVYVIV